MDVIGYLDSNWVGDHFDKKSTIRSIFTFYDRLISFGSKKQVVIILSSTEVKYMALNLASQKTI